MTASYSDGSGRAAASLFVKCYGYISSLFKLQLCTSPSHKVGHSWAPFVWWSSFHPHSKQYFDTVFLSSIHIFSMAEVDHNRISLFRPITWPGLSSFMWWLIDFKMFFIENNKCIHISSTLRSMFLTSSPLSILHIDHRTQDPVPSQAFDIVVCSRKWKWYVNVSTKTVMS